MPDFVQAAGKNTVLSAMGTRRGLCMEVFGKASRGVIEASFKELIRFFKDGNEHCS